MHWAFGHPGGALLHFSKLLSRVEPTTSCTHLFSRRLPHARRWAPGRSHEQCALRPQQRPPQAANRILLSSEVIPHKCITRGVTHRRGARSSLSPPLFDSLGEAGVQGQTPEAEAGWEGSQERRAGRSNAGSEERACPGAREGAGSTRHQGGEGVRTVCINSPKAPRIWHLPVITALLLFLTFMKTFIFSTANFNPFSNRPFLAMSRYDLLP